MAAAKPATRPSWRRPDLFIIALAFTVIALSVAFTTWEIRADYSNTLAEANRTAHMAAEGLKEHTAEAVLAATSPMWSAAQSIREQGGLKALSRERLHRVLKMQVAPDTPLDRLTILSAAGELLASSERPVPPGDFRFRKRQSIAEHLEGDTGDRLIVGVPTQLTPDSPLREAMQQQGSSTWVMPVTRALRGKDGKLEGVIVALFRSDYFRNFYDVLSQHRDASIALTRSDGIHLARHPFYPEFVGTDNRAVRDILFAQQARNELPIVHSRIDNMQRLFAWRHVDNLPLTVYVGLSIEDLLQDWRTRFVRRVAATVVFSLLVLALCFVLMRKLGALSVSEQRYRVLFDSSTIGILLVQNNIIANCNKEAQTLFKTDANEPLIGADLSKVLGETQAQLVLNFAARANPDNFPETTRSEWQLEACDGSVFWANVSLSVFDLRGKRYVLMMVADLSERKRTQAQLQALNQELEGRVKSRTEQLAQINSDLQAFNYSASHDLRAPIRRIRSFVELIQTEHTREFSEEVARLLARVDANATRMDEMLDNLLLLFTTNQSPLNPVELDLGEMARSILADLASDQPERRYELRLPAQSMQLYGDEGLLRLALTNLLSNAWKFTRKNEVSHFTIGRTLNGFYLRDDGVGFDTTHAEKLFTAFHRLHPDSEFQGTGIGLAIVKRVIERHGGRVWAQSVPGMGATFFFTIGSVETIDRLSAVAI